MPSLPRVLAICVNYNGKEVLSGTLKSLEETRYPSLELVVVDNASQDESAGLVPPSVPVRLLSENRGYAAALNTIVRETLRTDDGRSGAEAPEYFLFLNNDVRFGPAMVASLVEFAEQSQPGVFGPQVILDDGSEKLEAAWGRLTFSHVLCSFEGKGAQADEASDWNQNRQVQLLLGCVLLVHRSVIEQVGLLDERFFLYHEEVDFLYRAGRDGFGVFYCPFAKVYHRSGTGTRNNPLAKIYWVRRNTVYFLKKHRISWRGWAYFGLTLAASLAYNFLTLRWKKVGAIWRGVKDGLQGSSDV